MSYSTVRPKPVVGAARTGNNQRKASEQPGRGKALALGTRAQRTGIKAGLNSYRSMGMDLSYQVLAFDSSTVNGTCRTSQNFGGVTFRVNF